MEENNQVPWRYMKYNMTLFNDHFPSSKPAIFIFTKKTWRGWMDGQMEGQTNRWTDS